MADLMPMLKQLRATRSALLAEQVEAESQSRRVWPIQQRIDFPRLNLSQQRSFIGSAISAVVVYPPKTRGRQERDLSRLEVHYLDGEVLRLSNTRARGIFDLETGEWLAEQMFL